MFTTLKNGSPVRVYGDLWTAIAEAQAGIKWGYSQPHEYTIRRYRESDESCMTCEHGLSSDLCYGPNHYPADNQL